MREYVRRTVHSAIQQRITCLRKSFSKSYGWMWWNILVTSTKERGVYSKEVIIINIVSNYPNEHAW